MIIRTSSMRERFFTGLGSSATDVFAVGKNGTIVHYSGTTSALGGIWGNSTNNVSLSRENVRVYCSAILSVDHLGVCMGISMGDCGRRE